MLFPSQNSFQVIQGFKIHKQTLRAIIFQNCAINEFQEKLSSGIKLFLKSPYLIRLISVPYVIVKKLRSLFNIVYYLGALMGDESKSFQHTF